MALDDNLPPELSDGYGCIRHESGWCYVPLQEISEVVRGAREEFSRGYTKIIPAKNLLRLCGVKIQN
ncbi:MAG: hypothetical protein AABX12_04345 [Nanoarchaeota archaeon]